MHNTPRATKRWRPYARSDLRPAHRRRDWGGSGVRAAVYRCYGPPDVFRIEEVEAPLPGEGEVLIAVRAAAINPMDSHLIKGKPAIARLFFGLRRPKRTRPGVDVAGLVEAVGQGVTRFKRGGA